jgi:hypothetical protein
MGLFGGDTVWRQRLQRVWDQGFARLDFAFFMMQVAFPLILLCLDLLLVPFFLSRTLCLLVQALPSLPPYLCRFYALHGISVRQATAAAATGLSSSSTTTVTFLDYRGLDRYRIETLLSRYAYLAYFVLVQLAALVRMAASAFVRLHNRLRDSRYLIGTELTNRG